jgi:hypothetical protein
MLNAECSMPNAQCRMLTEVANNIRVGHRAVIIGSSFAIEHWAFGIEH